MAFRLAKLDKQSAQATEKVGAWAVKVEKAKKDLEVARQQLVEAEAGMQSAKLAAAKVQAERRRLLDSTSSAEAFGFAEDLWAKLGMHGPLQGGQKAEEALRHLHEAINSLRRLQEEGSEPAVAAASSPVEPFPRAGGLAVRPFQPTGAQHFPMLGDEDGDVREGFGDNEEEEDDMARERAMVAEAQAMEEAFRPSGPSQATGEGGYGQAPRQPVSRRSTPWSG